MDRACCRYPPSPSFIAIHCQLAFLAEFALPFEALASRRQKFIIAVMAAAHIRAI
jgi:hypothetical protein